MTKQKNIATGISNSDTISVEQREVIDAVIQVLREKQLTFKEASEILYLTRNELDNLALYSHL